MTVRGVRYVGERRLTVMPGQVRQPGPGEVRIDVAYTGICGTDLTVYNGKMDARVTLPGVLGHEMSGTIAEVGPDVDARWKPGVAVTVLPAVWCGQCPACTAGNHHVCHRLVFLGIDADGAMQNSWTVPAGNLVALPSDLDLRHGAMVEPLAVAVHAVERAKVQLADKVLVIGGGPVGLLIALVARIDGADVQLSEPDATRRAIAEAAGFETIDPTVQSLDEVVDRWTAGAGADIAFEVSGTTGGVSAAVASLKVRGRLTLVGVHTAPVEVDLYRCFWRELETVSARLYQHRDFERAVELVSGGRIDLSPLLSQVVGMDAAEDAFRTLELGGAMKVLVDCGTDRVDEGNQHVDA